MPPRLSAPARREQLLDVALEVFARQGFHHCRVSDVADQAGVAYGLVYHYFDSKEEMLNELFLERWQIMLDAISEIDARDELAPREKLHQVAGFIIDSYRHDPDLMNKAQQIATVRDGLQYSWWSEWYLHLQGNIQDAILGKQSVSDALKASAQKANELRKK